jgi:hypothetical protein
MGEIKKGLRILSWVIRLKMIIEEYTHRYPKRQKEFEQKKDHGDEKPLRAYMTVADFIHEDLAYMVMRRSVYADKEQISLCGAFLATLAIHDLTGKYPAAATSEIIETCELLRADGKGYEGILEFLRTVEG